MKWAIAYLSAGVSFGVLDFLWLRWAAPNLYRPVLGDLLAPQFRVAPAAVFYLIYIAAIIWFAVAPGMGLGWPLNVLGTVLPGEFAGVANAVINGALLIFVAWLSTQLGADVFSIDGFTSEGLEIASLGWAILAAIVMSIASFFTRAVLKVLKIR